MYCLVIVPQLCRNDEEVAALNNTFANPAHYEYMIEEDALVIGPDGIIARLVTNCLSDSLVAETRKHFAKVHGELTNRGSVLGAGSMMPRIRGDGSIGMTTEVPPSIIKQIKAQETYSDFLGWVDASKHGDRFPECRQTAWSVNKSIIHEAAGPFVREVDRIYREELPEHWQRQADFMAGVSSAWKFGDTTISTVTVNRNLRTTYHTDKNDFAGGMGNLIVLTGGDTGALVMPKFRVAFLPRPTDVLLMDVHQMHGNLPFTGERLTAVLYAREHIDQCGGW